MPSIMLWYIYIYVIYVILYIFEYYSIQCGTEFGDTIDLKPDVNFYILDHCVYVCIYTH